MRRLLAIARKDLLLMVRYPLLAVSRVVEPLTWLTPVYFLGRAFSRGTDAVGFAAWTGTGDYMAFVVVGWILSSYVSAVLWGMGFALKTEMDAGVLESNWLAPQHPAFLLVGRTLASVLFTTVTSAGFATLAVLLFGISIPGRLLPALTIALPAVVGLYGLGFLIAGVVLRMRDANTLIDIGNYVLGLLSGRDYPVSILPRPLIVLSLLLPLTYGYDGLRAALLGTRPLVPLPAEIGLAVLFMAATVAIGVWGFNRLERRCRVEGTLAQH
jgi:ABC-2 type transport system permease protein